MDNQVLENGPVKVSKGRRFGQIMLSLIPVAVMFTIQNTIYVVGGAIIGIKAGLQYKGDLDSDELTEYVINEFVGCMTPLMLVYGFIASIVFCIWYCKKYVRFNEIGATLKGIGIKFSCAALLAVVGAQMFAIGLLYTIQFMFPSLIETYTSIMEQGGMTAETTTTVWSILAFVIFIPITEELVFRGICMASLTKSGFGRKFLLFFPAAVFAIVHLNPLQIVYVFVLALVLGYAKLEKKTVLLTIPMHMLYNAMGTLMPAEWIEPLPEPVFAAFIAVGLALVAVSYLMARPKTQTA